MAEEDLLPLLGHNIADEDEENSGESDEEESLEVDGEAPAPAAEAEQAQAPPRQATSRGNTPQISYDPSLPVAHAYLGSDLEEVRGRTVHEEEACIQLPLLTLPGVVLVPGQTLPLHLFEDRTVAMVRHVLTKDKTFGLVNSSPWGNDMGPTLASIGTTAEIFSIKEEQDDMSGVTTVRVKAMGRQRFEIIETRRQTDGIILGQVRILSERELPDCLEGARPPSHQRLCLPPPPPTLAAGDHRGLLQNFLKTQSRRKYDRLSCANFTWWPPWVYKQYDAHELMRLVKLELQSWNETLKSDNMPEDPTELSFWVAGNLPLDDTMKLHLLKIDCAIQRLRCELSIMQRCTVLCCKSCGQLITKKNEVFCMSVGGPLAAYVNPGGYVHETLTVYKAQGLTGRGRASTENSWFPGYAWTIVECRACHSHMGWKFTVAKKKLKPEKFWGLCRSSLQPGLQRDEDNPDNADNADEWRPRMS